MHKVPPVILKLVSASSNLDILLFLLGDVTPASLRGAVDNPTLLVALLSLNAMILTGLTDLDFTHVS